MPSIERSPRRHARLILLAGLAGVLGSSVAGCSGGGGSTLSAESRVRAKAVIKKKFQDFGEGRPTKGRR